MIRLVRSRQIILQALQLLRVNPAKTKHATVIRRAQR